MKIDPSIMARQTPDQWQRAASHGQGEMLADMFQTRADAANGSRPIRRADMATPPPTEGRAVPRTDLPAAPAASMASPVPASGRARAPIPMPMAKMPAPSAEPVARTAVSLPATPPQRNDLALAAAGGKGRHVVLPLPVIVPRRPERPTDIAVRLAEAPRGLDVSIRLFSPDWTEPVLRERVVALLSGHGLSLAQFTLNGVPDVFGEHDKEDA